MPLRSSQSLHAGRCANERSSKACTHAQLTRTSRCSPVRAATWDFKSSTDASMVTSSLKQIMPASDRWSFASLGSTVAIARMPRRTYSFTRASPIPPWPHLEGNVLASDTWAAFWRHDRIPCHESESFFWRHCKRKWERDEAKSLRKLVVVVEKTFSSPQICPQHLHL